MHLLVVYTVYSKKKADYKIVTLNISTYFIFKHLEHNVGTDVLDSVINLKPVFLMPALTRHCTLAMKSNFDTG